MHEQKHGVFNYGSVLLLLLEFTLCKGCLWAHNKDGSHCQEEHAQQVLC